MPFLYAFRVSTGAARSSLCFPKNFKKGKSIGDGRYRLTLGDKNFGEDDESSTHKILRDIHEYLWYK